MYTQCTHCGAVFRVKMKELTVAQGKLRCGECDGVFIATETLTTTLPRKESLAKEEIEEDGVIDTDVLTPQYKRSTEKYKLNRLQFFTVIALLSLLVAQFLYTNKNWFTHELKRNPEQVKTISRNIISHPNDSGVLLISASIENKAEHAQPYPYVEVTLLDNKENTIALRRFKPKEYLLHYSEGEIFPSNKETSLQLKIADPGKKATHFNFRFM
ncbi:MAG: zinc-ribbon and DUF3426 domain-containing protein [Cocleimonas sp.]|nr:zinc-ribbon and DUF3426 domain-containing protein [Cocleimonas sp.]